jgi:hypothetical protein
MRSSPKLPAQNWADSAVRRSPLLQEWLRTFGADEKCAVQGAPPANQAASPFEIFAFRRSGPRLASVLSNHWMAILSTPG